MKWFKHDANANMDSKLQEVLLDYGLEGYGLYFYCLELVAANVERHNLTFELEHDARIIARNTGSTVEKVQQMMSRFIELRLFENSDGVITCLKMMQRTDEYTCQLIREEKRKENNGLPSIPRDSLESPETLPRNSEVKEKKRREETDKTNGVGGAKKTKRFSPPSVDEVQAYCSERGNSLDPQEFIDHYEANGWMRGKNKIKDWKACVRTWESSRAKKKPKGERW